MNRLTSTDRTEDNLVDSFGYNPVQFTKQRKKRERLRKTTEGVVNAVEATEND